METNGDRSPFLWRHNGEYWRPMETLWRPYWRPMGRSPGLHSYGDLMETYWRQARSPIGLHFLGLVRGLSVNTFIGVHSSSNQLISKKESRGIPLLKEF